MHKSRKPKPVKISINGKAILAAAGEKLIDVAEKNGIIIPSMCRNNDVEHFTSCMVCLVTDKSTGNLIPSCSIEVNDGMDIDTRNAEIMEARKTALELLLSEHAGDCDAPCRIACPAFMDIPQMNRLIAVGQTDKALEVVMEDIALPGVLGRICPAPCEGACKRKPIDEPVAICLLKRFAADESVTIPRKKTTTGTKKVAVIGSGPAGLAAGYYLHRKGIQAVVIDRHPLPGGSLRYDIPDEKLDKSVLDREIKVIRDAGVQFTMGQNVDSQRFSEICQSYDAVVIATGNFSPGMDAWGLSNNGKQILVDKNSYLTNIGHVFAIGNVNRKMQLAIRSQAQGKEVAVAVEQLLNGLPVTGEIRRFNSTLGKLMPEEHEEYLKEGSRRPRQAETEPGSGLLQEQAAAEAARCLHCDCRKPDSCRLRQYADEYKAQKRRFAYSQRKPVKKHMQQNLLVYEPGKCIKCGICVRLTALHREEFGFTFVGRGFDVEVGVPFNEPVAKAFIKTADLVARACPTGALAAFEK